MIVRPVFGHAPMLIVYGAYHWRPKRVAFRSDYCLSCAAPRRAVRIRTFDVGHIFWIPILPVGFWQRWLCGVCGKNPHQNLKTRPQFKWAGLIVLLVLSGIFWASPPESPRDMAFWWGMRIVPLAAALALFIHIRRSPVEPTLKERLASIPPATDSNCPFCATTLMIGAHSYCPACGVERC